MSDDYQIDIPPSFFALYADARRPYRLREPIGVVRARYEVCEDLATHLIEPARIQAHAELPSEEEVLTRIHAGLCSAGADMSADEARWVVTRLAELLGWRAPGLAD